MNRREFFAATAGVAASPLVGPSLAQAAPGGADAGYPLVPALPPLTKSEEAELAYWYVRGITDALSPGLSEVQRVRYQHVAGRHWCKLSWPHADAPERLDMLSKQWPRLKRNVDLVISARIEGAEDWPWDYDKVRLDEPSEVERLVRRRFDQALERALELSRRG